MRPKAKEPVRMRFRQLTNGNTSIYLDIYSKGRRRYEFLKLYIIPESTRMDKERNKETMRLAEAIKAKRVLELQNDRYDFAVRRDSGINLRVYFERMVSKHEGRTLKVWVSCLNHLRIYEPDEKLKLEDVDASWARGLVSYFLNEAGVSRNTAFVYLSKFKCCFSRAVRDGLLSRSPFASIDTVKTEDREREYLTIDEVRALSETPCASSDVKRAFLFGCLTGLRFSDIKALTWGEVKTQGGFTRVVFRQQKTRSQEYLDITSQAVELLGTRGTDGDFVFTGLPDPRALGRCLSRWVKAAGIDKHITFHCSRHTFAVMMLDIGTDIYTVSKLLGHRSLETTQIYAKILDKNKQKAVQMIPDILSGEK